MPVEEYVYDGDAVLQVTDGAGVTQAEYTSTGQGYGDLLSAFDGSAAKYYEPDALGSTDALADQSQAVVDRWAYRAFGSATQTLGTDTTPFTWVGRQGYYSDSQTGLYQLGNGTRYYDPQTAQFLSDDPIGFSGGDANNRRYASNNPVNLIDATGLDDSFSIGRSDQTANLKKVLLSGAGQAARDFADALALLTCPLSSAERKFLEQVLSGEYNDELPLAQIPVAKGAAIKKLRECTVLIFLPPTEPGWFDPGGIASATTIAFCKTKLPRYIKDLGDDDFDTRKRAREAVAKMLDFAFSNLDRAGLCCIAGALLKARNDSGDAEIERAVDLLVESYRTLLYNCQICEK